MKMKGKGTKEMQEKSKTKRKSRKKVKRQVSIFTVMLWVFLITTMITITVNSTKKTNALEVEDENWNIQLVTYDRSSETPNQAITEFTWNAESSSERKELCMQIDYACTTNKGYQPGEIEITISGIYKDSWSEYYRNLSSNERDSYENWLAKNVVIAADRIGIVNKKYDWSYSYNVASNIYTFTNNSTIAENEHFEGTIQIVYNLKPYFRIKTDLEYVAKIREKIENAEEIIAKESNVCNFHYTSMKNIYSISKKGVAGARTDYTKVEEILDNYYWVRYSFSKETNYAIIRTIEEDVIETLPEGCVLYDWNLNEIRPDENNMCHNLKAGRTVLLYRLSQR